MLGTKALILPRSHGATGGTIRDRGVHLKLAPKLLMLLRQGSGKSLTSTYPTLEQVLQSRVFRPFLRRAGA